MRLVSRSCLSKFDGGLAVDHNVSCHGRCERLQNLLINQDSIESNWFGSIAIYSGDCRLDSKVSIYGGLEGIGPCSPHIHIG